MLLHDVLFTDGRPSSRFRIIDVPDFLWPVEYFWEVRPNEILFVPSDITEKLLICTINTDTKMVRPLKWQPAKNQ